MKNVNTRGFTLIELVVVIALLGILAAFAIPRFASLEREARTATVQGLSGSLRSSAAMAHGLFLATGASPVAMEGNNITIANGYPDAATVQLTLADLTGFTPATVGATTTFTKDGATTPANCSVAYTEAPANGAPNIVVDTTDC